LSIKNVFPRNVVQTKGSFAAEVHCDLKLYKIRIVLKKKATAIKKKVRI